MRSLARSSPDPPPARWVSITVWVSIAVAAISLILAAAIGWVTEGSIRLGHIDDAINAGELSRVQLTTAAVVVGQVELGMLEPAVGREAVRAASASLEEFARAMRELPEFSEVGDEYLVKASALSQALSAGKKATYLPLLEDTRLPLERVTQVLNKARSEHEKQLLVLRSRTSPVMLVATFVVVLAGPLALIGAHQSWMGRRLEAGKLREKLKANEEILQSKNEFLANVSHELRTPLTGIFGLTQVLEQEGTDPDEAKELISLISQESGELLRMIDDILTLGRSDAGVLSYKPQLLDPRKEIATVLDPFRRHRGFTVECDDTQIWADPLRLRQVLRNLVSNAHRHGGASIEVEANRTAAGFAVTVRDDGPGVPPHLLDALFNRFLHRDTTPLLAGSIGLGLHIARVLAEGMGGTLEYGRNGMWTEFRLVLPQPVVSEPARRELVHVG